MQAQPDTTGTEAILERLTVQLAQQVMGWGVAPDRFLLPNRGWMPRWRFQPTVQLADAFSLLEHAKPETYNMGAVDQTQFSVKVSIRGKVGQAEHTSKPRAITLAIARALGIEIAM